MSDPIQSAAKGAVEGVLDWTKVQIEELARKIKDREVGFVEDKPTAEAIRKQKETSEFKILADFVPKGYLRTIIKLGLTLRGIENEMGRVAKFKNEIFDQFGTNGVRVAELVQIGIISQLLTHLVKLYKSPKDVQKRLLTFLEQVDQLAIFVSKDDLKSSARIAQVAMTRVDANPSQMVIIFGRGEKAVLVVLKILKELKADKRGYLIETEQAGYQLTAFVFSPEVKERASSKWDMLTSSP